MNRLLVVLGIACIVVASECAFSQVSCPNSGQEYCRGQASPIPCWASGCLPNYSWCPDGYPQSQVPSDSWRAVPVSGQWANCLYNVMRQLNCKETKEKCRDWVFYKDTGCTQECGMLEDKYCKADPFAAPCGNYP